MLGVERKRVGGTRGRARFGGYAYDEGLDSFVECAVRARVRVGARTESTVELRPSNHRQC